MRHCTNCGEKKPPEMFYKYSSGKPMARCKECTKSSVRKHRLGNIDRIREYDRGRSNLPHRVEARRKYLSAFKENQPERRAAHTAVGNAVRCGKLQKEPCAFCGDTGRVEAHHHDYTKPLDVTWLCVPCHRRFHALERMATYDQPTIVQLPIIGKVA